MFYLKNVPHAVGKNISCCQETTSSLHDSEVYLAQSIVQIPYFIENFLLVDLAIVESGILTYPITVILIPISSFVSIKISFKH